MRKPTLDEWMAHAVGMGKGWTLTWEFSNSHVRDKKFLTEAEALAFVERSIEGDPNVLVWNLKEEV